MVFSNELVPHRLGTALAVPCRCPINTPHQLFEEAEALWDAEQPEARDLGAVASGWGAVGLLCNPSSEGLDELKTAWMSRIATEQRVYRDFRSATGEKPAVAATGFLTIPWPNTDAGAPLVTDLLLATSNVPKPLPGGQYATPNTVAHAWTAANDRHYFDNNRQAGITTAFDDEILRALNS
jgi:hypothetical protein